MIEPRPTPEQAEARCGGSGWIVHPHPADPKTRYIGAKPCPGCGDPNCPNPAPSPSEQEVRHSAVAPDSSAEGARGELDRIYELWEVQLKRATALEAALRELHALILSKMAAATNRDLACDGGVGDEEGKVWAEIEALARDQARAILGDSE